jgi:hypothetical protein
VGATLDFVRSAVGLFDRHAGFVMALLTATYVLATWILVRLAYKQLRAAFELERNRTRPMVSLDLVVEHYFVHVSLRNLGQTIAQNIKITVQPDIRSLYGGKFEGVYLDPSEEGDEPVPFLQEGVISLAPGREIKGELGYIERFRQHYGAKPFEGTISYCGYDGSKYAERVVLDLGAHRGLGHIERYEIHDVAEALRKLDGHVKTIANTLMRP